VKIILLSRILILIALLQTPAYAANNEPAVKATTDKTAIYIGDRIKYSISARSPRGVEVKFPDLNEGLIGKFEVRDSEKAEKDGMFGNKTYLGTYYITTYDTGDAVIPPIEIKYKKKDAKDWSFVKTKEIKINVASVLPKGKTVTDIKDIKGPISYREVNMPFIIGLILGLITGAWLIRAYIRHRMLKLVKLPHEIALGEIEAVKIEFDRIGDVKRYFVGISDAARNYIEKVFKLKAPEMTSEEFLNSLKDASELSVEHKRLLGEFLASCDLVKFARYSPAHEEMGAVYDSAKNFINETRASLEAKRSKS
jgi:hypothetical protein